MGPSPEDVACSADDSRTLLAQSIVDRAIYRLRIRDDALVAAGPPIVFDNGAPVGIGVQVRGGGRAADGAGHARERRAVH